MNKFYIITYKEFEKRRLIDKTELINVEDVEVGLNHLKTMNAQKRLTTTDYRVIDLTKLLADNSLKIEQNVKTE